MVHKNNFLYFYANVADSADGSCVALCDICEDTQCHQVVWWK